MRRGLPRVLIEIGCMIASALLAHGLPAQAAAPPDRSGPDQLQAWDDVAIAGLPPGSHPEVLTWEQAYTLALIRCRTPRPAGEQALDGSLDPKELAEQARRVGVDDFERFRKDFFEENGGNTFVDPSGSLFDLLRRLQTVENARSFVAALEQLKAAYQAQPNPRRPDRLDGWLQKARRRFQDELRAYREQLGKLKAELGLSPQAPVVPDRTSLAGFRAVFDRVDDWFRNPERDPARLPALVAELPRLDHGIPGQLTPGGNAEGDPNWLDALLRDAEKRANENRGQGDLDDAVRQRVRRLVRQLFEARAAYAKEAQQWLRALQSKNRAFEQMMTPHPPGAIVKVPDLIALEAEILESESRLVAQWASSHAARLALARDVRWLPYHDWKSFLAQIP